MRGYHSNNEKIMSRPPGSTPPLSAAEQQRLFRIITSTIDIDELLAKFAACIEASHHFHGYAINLLDEAGENLVCEKIRLPEKHRAMEATLRGYRLPLALPDINTTCLHEQRRIVLHDDQTHADPVNANRFELWELSSLAILPLHCDDAAIGTLMLLRQDGKIEPDWLPPLAAYFQYFAGQIRNALAYRRLQKQTAQFETLQHEHEGFRAFVSQINNLTSEEQVYEMISHEFLRRYRFDVAAILMREDNLLVVKKCTDISGKYGEIMIRWNEYAARSAYRLDLADGASAAVFLRNSPLLFRDVMEVLHLPMSQKDRDVLKILETPRTFLCMPIRQDGQPVGILWLWSLEKVVDIGEVDVRTIEQLCAFIGTAIANAKLYSTVHRQHQEIELLNERLRQQNEQLAQLAIKDRLTGLYNFGYFQEELQRRLKAHRRHKTAPLSLVMLDIDHFKQFNDTFGHPAGNLALIEIARHIDKMSREVDIVCRYGGEEFTVILPDCDLSGAMLFCERLRLAVEAHPVHIGDSTVALTISAGCAEHVDDENATRLIERADAALYQAKQSGRNCVRTAD